MEGDSNDEGTDSEFEGPSAALDRGRAMRVAITKSARDLFTEWVTVMLQ
jgi:hypothetical protein